MISDEELLSRTVDFNKITHYVGNIIPELVYRPKDQTSSIEFVPVPGTYKETDFYQLTLIAEIGKISFGNDDFLVRAILDHLHNNGFPNACFEKLDRDYLFKEDMSDSINDYDSGGILERSTSLLPSQATLFDTETSQQDSFAIGYKQPIDRLHNYLVIFGARPKNPSIFIEESHRFFARFRE